MEKKNTFIPSNKDLIPNSSPPSFYLSVYGQGKPVLNLKRTQLINPLISTKGSGVTQIPSSFSIQGSQFQRLANNSVVKNIPKSLSEGSKSKRVYKRKEKPVSSDGALDIKTEGKKKSSKKINSKKSKKKSEYPIFS
jgi:hypothetical protein